MSRTLSHHPAGHLRMGLGLRVTLGGLQVSSDGPGVAFGCGWGSRRMKLPATLKENPCGLSETVEQWAEEAGRSTTTSTSPIRPP